MATQLEINRSAPPFYVDDNRYERINGQMVERPVSGDIHSDVQENLRRLLAEQARMLEMKARSEWSVTQPSTADLEQPNYLTPDILVAHVSYQRTKAGHLIPPGFLAVEVISPGQDDLFDKAQMYAAWGIEHVWLVNPQSRVCLEYHGGDQFTIVKSELRAGALSVRLKDIFRLE